MDPSISKFSFKNSRGQFAIETILIMLIMVSALLWTTNMIREEQLLAKLIGGPWAKVNGMIECGSWAPQKDACQNHPAQRDRVLSYDPRN
ncbi:MAG: hypothetical protein ACLGGX_00400 [Bdellovibrionia bacterium]